MFCVAKHHVECFAFFMQTKEKKKAVTVVTVWSCQIVVLPPPAKTKTTKPKIHIPQFNAPSNRDKRFADLFLINLFRFAWPRQRRLRRRRLKIELFTKMKLIQMYVWYLSRFVRWFFFLHRCILVKWWKLMVAMTWRAVKHTQQFERGNKKNTWQLATSTYSVCTFFGVRKMICAFAQCACHEHSLT